LSFKITLFWASKRRRFGILSLKKKKKKRKKKKENIKKKKKGGGGGGKEISHPHGWSGVVEPMAKPAMGFGLLGVAGPKDLDSATPKGRFGVDESTPRSLGVVRPPPKGQNPFFVFFFFFFFLGFWGWPDHPFGQGVVRPRPARPPHFWPRGWLEPPPISFPHFFFFFFNIFLFLFSFLF
jgi:hypothetical protein